MSSRTRKWDGEYVEVDPSKRRRSESYFQSGSPSRHNFHRGDRFPGRQSQKYELFFGWQSPFSQHHPVKFTIDGKEFNCAEQYYMYRKAALFEDKDIEEKIMNSRDPKEQKRLGKQIQNFDFDTWMQHSQEVVEKGNMAKFSQNPHLKKKLFATAPRLMVEASPYDATWGIALHKYDPRAWDERTWQGQNLLGQIITKVRDNLMRQDGHLDDYSDSSTHRSPVLHKEKTDSQASSTRRDSTSSLGTQRSPVFREQMMDSRVAGCGRDSERDSDCGLSRSPARKRQRTDGQDTYSRRDSERLAEVEDRKCERRRKKELRRRSLERSLQKSESEDTDSDSDSSSSSDDSDRGSRSVMCQTPKGENHLRKKKKKKREVGQKKNEECSSSHESSLERHDRRKHIDSSISSKSEDLKRMDRKIKTAEFCIAEEGKKVDGKDNELDSERGERLDDTDRLSKDSVYVKVNPLKRRRSESYFQSESPYRHSFPHGNSFLGRQSQKYELFFGWQSPFSQHHPAKFTVDGKEFNCAEQYYMYRKAALFEDKDIEEKIMNSRDPKEQKRLGKQIENFDFDTWMQHSQEVVEKGNMAKFSQNPHLKKKLFATAPRRMVEASPHDATWGIALHKYDPRAWDERTWQGQNLLGQIITKVRDNLMRQDGHLDDNECNSDGSIHGNPVTHQRKTDPQAGSRRRESTSSLSTQRIPVSREQKMDSRVAGCGRDSERDNDCVWSRSPARKRQRTDGQDRYSRRENERSAEMEKERKCERRRKKESRRRRLERSLQKSESEDTESDSDSSSSSDDSDRGSRSVMRQAPKGEKHSRKKKKKKTKVGQRKNEERSGSSEGGRRKKYDDSSSSSKSEDWKGMDRKIKTAEFCIADEGKKVDGKDNEVESGRGERQDDTDRLSKDSEVESGRGERQDDTDRHSKEKTTIDTDTDGGCMHSKVISEGNSSQGLGDQQQKSYDTEDGKRLSSSVRHSKHSEARTGSEGQIEDNQRREDSDLVMRQDDTLTEKLLHGGEHDIDAFETGSKMKKENSEHQENKKEDHLVVKGKGESGKAEKGGGGEAVKGEREDVFPAVVETQVSDIPQGEHASWENMDTENTAADKGSDRADNESVKVSRDEADDDKSGQETIMKLIPDHKLAGIGVGAEGGNGQVEEDAKGSQAECQMIHIKPFKKSDKRHYRDNKKVSDTDSGEMDARRRRSRKHMDSGKRQRHKSGNRRSSRDRGSRDVSKRTSESRRRNKYFHNVCRSIIDLNERTTRDASETRHDIRVESFDRERSRKRKRDRSRISANSTNDRTCHQRDSETSKKDKDIPRKEREASKDNMARKDREASKNSIPRKEREASKDNMARKDREDSKNSIPRKDREASKDKDKDSKVSHNRKVIGGNNTDAKKGESPKEHKQRKQTKDNCTNKDQKKKKKKKKVQEINEKRNKKKAQRKEMRKQRKALKKERSRSEGQGQGDKGEG